MVPWVMKIQTKGEAKQQSNRSSGKEEGKEQSRGKAEQRETETDEKTFYRYYHLYRRGELEEDVSTAGGRVLEAGWERDNWWVIAVRDERRQPRTTAHMERPQS